MPAPAPPPPDASLARLSVLDWIGVLVVGVSGLFGLTVPLVVAPMFRRLSESLGATDTSLASRVLQGWVPLALGLRPLVVLAAALLVPLSLMRRRVLLVLAFALTVVASGVLLFALYGTLFAVAGSAAGQ